MVFATLPFLDDIVLLLRKFSVDFRRDDVSNSISRNSDVGGSFSIVGNEDIDRPRTKLIVLELSDS